MGHLFDECEAVLPAGRALNETAVATYWGHVDKTIKQAEKAAQDARKFAERTGADPNTDQQARRAADELVGVQGEAKMARRRIIEETSKGREPWTVARDLMLDERIAEEERQDRSRAAWGDDPLPAEQRETRELRREIQRLRAQLGATK